MKLSLTKDHKYVVVEPESRKDSKVLKEFPGLLSSRGTRYFPAKINLCKNIVKRLKDHLGGTVNLDKGTYDLYTSEFKLKEIPSSFKYFTTPLRHQEVALRFLYTNRGGGLLLDPGLGKTKVVLDYLALMNFSKSLIVCPKALLFVWQDEVAVHRRDKTIHVRKSMSWDRKIRTAEGHFNRLGAIEKRSEEDEDKYKRYKYLLNSLLKGKEKDEAGTKAADIVVVNYEKCVQGKYDLPHLGFEFMAIDEGLVKDRNSQRSKAISALSRGMASTVIMSGTLVNNTPVDIYSPMKIMEPSLVGRNFQNFEFRYCNMAKTKHEDGSIKGRFVVGFKRVDEIKEILETVSVIMRKEEWLDLPPKKFITVGSTPTEEQMRMVKELSANYITEYGNRYIEVDSPLTVMGKIYQFSNGFFYENSEESDIGLLFGQEGRSPKNNRETVFLPDNPKISALRNLITNTLSKRKFILWYNLDAEFYIIEHLLKEMNISRSVIRGGEKHTGSKVKEFNSNPDIQVLVCQAKSVNYGITVLGSTPDKLDSSIEVVGDIDPQVYTEVFYSLNFSLEVYLQQQDRIHRIGQTRECEYYILINETPVEIKIFQALETKMVLRNTVLVDIVNQIKEGFLV